MNDQSDMGSRTGTATRIELRETGGLARNDAAFVGALAMFSAAVVWLVFALWPPAPHAPVEKVVPAAAAASPQASAPGSDAVVKALQARARAQPPGRLPQFGGEPASADARLVARWALHTGDNGERAVVIVDKQAAKVYVFGRDGTFQGATPALVGSAVGDHTVPGVGDKPIAQVLPAERTTPAGRFIAEPGVNASGEDVVWVDYDAAVSMHRVRPTVKAERRLQRLASPTAQDNRITFGCINLPVAFYEKVLSPTVRSAGAVVYVLPETEPAATLLGAYDVPDAAQVAGG